jgi:peptidyl-prolyl cis-trans isomerase SurA
MMRFGTFRNAGGVMAVTLIAAAAMAQPGGGQPAGAQPAAGPRLNIPAEVNFVPIRQGPVVARATAIVNDEIITQSDVNQRVALFLASQRADLSSEDMERLRAQVLRSLIDEALQIQSAREKEVKIEQKEVDTTYARFAKNFGHTPASFSQYLKTIGASERTVKRQILGELSWQQLQRRLPRVSVSDEEVADMLKRMTDAKGAPEYHVAEIFIRSTPENASQVRGQMVQVIDQLRRGANFASVARQISDATTAARGGDLGWVTAERLSAIAPEIATVVQQMPVGTISDPIQLASGYSVVALVDSRQILVANPRDAVLSLMQMSVELPAGTSEAVARQRAEQLAQATQAMGGCGGAAQTASAIGASLVSNDAVKVRDLPPQLQQTLLGLSIGQVTQPFGSTERINVLALCGRDDPQAATPTLASIADGLEDERMGRQAQRYLRDLRRDAVIEYR